MTQGARLGNVAIDCNDVQKMQSFYADLLGWEKLELYGCAAVRDRAGVVILFMAAEGFRCERPVWPEKPGQQQKQMHFDFQVDDVPEAVRRAEIIGAVKAEGQQPGNDWVAMLDPEGHPFCLCAQ